MRNVPIEDYRLTSTTSLQTRPSPQNERLHSIVMNDANPQRTKASALRELGPVKQAFRLFDELEIDGAAVGGRVANIYRASERSTIDYDFLISRFDGLLEALIAKGYEILHDGEWLIRARHEGELFDFSLAEIDFQQVVIARAAPFDGVATREDIVIQKVIAWRSQDQEDVHEIFAANPAIDLGLMRAWCSALDDGDNLYSKRLENAVARHQSLKHD